MASTKKQADGGMAVSFAHAIGDEVIHKEHAVAGVVISASIDRTGTHGYWLEYKNAAGDVKELFARAGQLKAGQAARK